MPGLSDRIYQNVYDSSSFFGRVSFYIYNV